MPRELGGGGADVDELAAMLRTLAYHCGSTALALLHAHPPGRDSGLALEASEAAAAVEPLLKRIASERILLLSSGGSDWIAGSGKAEKVDGGYRINARKIFSSGAPTGDLLMTGAVLEEPGEPPMVLHFGVPMNSPHVKVLDTWRTLGMRGTGSHDVLIDGHVVPDAAVAVKRKAGEWHPLFQIIATIAFPLIYSVYLGVAESARDIALELAKRKKPDRHTIDLAGRMDTELTGARLGLDQMLAAVRLNAPSADTINQVMIGRQLVARHAIAAVELAMELAGGAGFYRVGRPRAPLPRHPGRPLSSAAVGPAGRIRGLHGAWAAGGSDLLKPRHVRDITSRPRWGPGYCRRHQSSASASISARLRVPVSSESLMMATARSISGGLPNARR